MTPVNGLFEIIRTRPRWPATATSRLILVCRGGLLFGADPEGRVYMGRLLTQREHRMRLSAVRGIYEIPVRRASTRRLRTNRPSIGIPITGEVDPFARSQNATVCVGDKHIDIEITYLGPLPP